MSQDNEHAVLMKIEGAPSRYMTWGDYSIRMKQSTVSVEDYERFYRKYYGYGKKFIVTGRRPNVPTAGKTPEQTLYGSISREIETKALPRIVRSEPMLPNSGKSGIFCLPPLTNNHGKCIV